MEDRQILGGKSTERAVWGTRTPDPRITNALLYQLSQYGEKKPENFAFSG